MAMGRDPDDPHVHGEHFEMRSEGEMEPPVNVHAFQPPATLGFFERNFAKVFGAVRGIDERVNKSTFGRVFRLRGSGHPDEVPDANFSTEIRAGMTTFATMAYIIAVNAAILADTGFDCVCHPTKGNIEHCGNQEEWDRCYNEVKLDLITATAAISGLASILFGFLTNMPVCLAPGMGLNAYFAFQVVGYRGTGMVSYRLALTATFVEGWIFMLLALTGLRHWLVKVIPGTIKVASGVGIGLFLTLIGMSYSSGIGIVTGGKGTPLTIGGCPPEQLNDNGECLTGMWVGILCGGLLTAFLMAFRVKSAIIIGIAVVSILSWPRNTSITYFPDTPEGNSRWDFFSQVVAFHPIKHTLAVQQWNLHSDKETASHFCLALFTFLYVDIIDCTATLYSMARFSRKMKDGDTDFPRSTIAYCTDAFCISIGALFGCSPVTAFIESGAGIAEGGRTGLTAIVAGLCFLISIFFAPIFASIPPWATGCTLILVGCLMIRQVTKVNWAYIGDAVPSFVTIAFIPFCYSVAYGLIAGLFTYVALNILIWIVIQLSRGSVTPKDYDRKEYWTLRPEGEKPWIIRIFSGNRAWSNSANNRGSDSAVLRPGQARSVASHDGAFSLNGMGGIGMAETTRGEGSAPSEDCGLSTHTSIGRHQMAASALASTSHEEKYSPSSQTVVHHHLHHPAPLEPFRGLP
ncbi:permease family-domain-containing protein [Apodospora peruviana]|uniref:Permease family-domain-containing protein n=1 Tax=Apodospora peruviana TaxID=516989 RepID=A0AAE0II27_9PEZI|nr:permease family-domain-containing protein [Apodospora peruviana]